MSFVSVDFLCGREVGQVERKLWEKGVNRK